MEPNVFSKDNKNNNDNKYENDNNNNNARDGFTVDACFGAPLLRLDVDQLPSYWNYDETTGNCSGITDQGALYSFEEFIEHRCSPPRAIVAIKNDYDDGGGADGSDDDTFENISKNNNDLNNNTNNKNDSNKNDAEINNKMMRNELATISATLTDEMLNFGNNLAQPLTTKTTTAATTIGTTAPKEKQHNKKQRKQQDARRADSTPKCTTSRQFKIFARSAKRSSAYELTRKSQHKATETATPTTTRAASLAATEKDSAPSTSAILQKAFCPTIKNNVYGVKSDAGDDNESEASAYAYYNGENLSRSREYEQRSTTIPSIRVASDSNCSFQRAFDDSADLDTIAPDNKNNNQHERALTRTAPTTARNDASYNGAIEREVVTASSAGRPYQSGNHTEQQDDNNDASRNNNNTNNNDNIINQLLSKMLCCFRATINIVDVRRTRRYVVNDENQQQHGNRNVANYRNNELSETSEPSTSCADNSRNTIAVENPLPKYSWDRESRNGADDENNFCVRNRRGELLLRRAGQINGQQFTIENCTNCIIVALDNTASGTIDDCQDCLIVLGPCKGSVFIRDSSHCALFAICQQFRARDCSKVSAHLFCATAPTIEDSSVEFGPLTMCYNRIEEQLEVAELSPLVNNWHRVHNFTPETAKFKLEDMADTQVADDTDNIVANFAMNERFRREFLDDPRMNNLNLTFRPSSSFFFHALHGDERLLSQNEEKVLLLVKSFDKRTKVKNSAEMYHDVRRLLKKLLSERTSEPASARSKVALLGLYDVNVKPGEYETLLRLKPNNKSPGGKIIGVELRGDAEWLRKNCADALASIGNSSSVELLDSSAANFAAQQLQRFSEAQNLT